MERIYGYLENDGQEIGERIGVQNVIYRLKMVYGDNMSLFIDSSPGEGTYIRITFHVQYGAGGKTKSLPGS